MNHNETDVFELKYDSWRIFLLAAGSFVFALIATWLIITGQLAPGSFKEVAAWGGVPFFVLCGLVWLRRLFDRGVVVSVSSDGIMDTRISANMIPWASVRSISIAEIKRQRFAMLDLSPEFERAMNKTRVAAMSKPTNAAMGFSGFAFSATGLDGSLDDFLAAIQRFHPGASNQHS